MKDSIPLFTFPADIRLQADTSKALPALAESVKKALTPRDIQRVEKRAASIAERHKEKRELREQNAAAASNQMPIAPEWLAYCINQAIDPETIVLDETVTNTPLVSASLSRSQPGTMFTSGGSSLGWALGAGLGCKLAAPERTVVVLVGDGAFLYGCPTSAIWAAQTQEAPFLTVIFNNQMHYATKRSWVGAYPEGVGQRTGEFVGVNLTPSPDYALLAQACHAYGEVVEDPAEVPSALQRALEAVNAGQAAVLDVRIQRP